MDASPVSRGGLYLNLGLPAFKWTVKRFISPCLSHPVCDILLQLSPTKGIHPFAPLLRSTMEDLYHTLFAWELSLAVGLTTAERAPGTVRSWWEVDRPGLSPLGGITLRNASCTASRRAPQQDQAPLVHKGRTYWKMSLLAAPLFVAPVFLHVLVCFRHAPCTWTRPPGMLVGEPAWSQRFWSSGCLFRLRTVSRQCWGLDVYAVM